MLKYALLALASGIFALPSWAQKASDYKVESLPGLDIADLAFNQYAGHIQVDAETDGNLFFWLLEQPAETSSKKLILWLNGGPGCSSMDGLFLENGPFRVNTDLTLKVQQGGWQDHASIVFLDQPVGTGFSYVNADGYLDDMTKITDSFLVFLKKFYTIFPELESYDLYLTGESFAGTYIPYFAKAILDYNQNVAETGYNLQGLAIGNGWISPRHQYDAYYDFGVAKGLIQEERKEAALNSLDHCHKELDNDDKINVSICENILDLILDDSRYKKDGKYFCMNQYDIRMKDEDESCGMAWPHELPSVKAYLQQPELRSAVHSSSEATEWNECSNRVSKKLANDDSKPSYHLLPKILSEIPILLFSGDQDLICNTLGTEYLITNMTWNGETGWQEAEPLKWYIGDDVVGTVTESRNLSLVVIHGGSHMVPYDKPIETLDMINRFIGVGNNMVHGTPSRVGDGIQAAGEPATEGDGEELPGDQDQEKEGGETDWSQYYSWGTSALIVMILFAGVAAYCCYKSRKQSEPDYRRGSRSGSSGGEGILGSAMGVFGKSKSSKRPTLRLEDHDDANELDELVNTSPTLFSAEELSDDELRAAENGQLHNVTQKSKGPTRFAIVEGDDDDDDFEDFTSWDESPSVEETKDKKAGKTH